MCADRKMQREMCRNNSVFGDQKLNSGNHRKFAHLRFFKILYLIDIILTIARYYTDGLLTFS